jgi:Tol biopolymer transport system component
MKEKQWMKSSMRHKNFVNSWVGIALAQVWLGTVTYGSSLQLLSVPDSHFAPTAGGGGDSYLPVVSRDGRYVLFGSTADNLVAPGTNRSAPALVPTPLNVFLRDRTNGTTVLVSVNLDGTGGGNGDSLPTGISTNGRYALFESRASNLVAFDTNNAPDVFMRDLQSGTTALVSGGPNGTLGDNASYSSVMTPDGRYVAFASLADNFVPGDTNGIADVFVRDMVSNVTTLVSVGAQLPANFGPSYPYYFQRGHWASDTPAITPDGRYITFYSTATNLVPGVGTTADVYLRDQQMGTTLWVSSGALAALQSLTPASNALSFNHAVSDDGRFVAFETVPDPKSPAALLLRFDSQTAQTEVVETNAAPATIEYVNVQNLSLTPDGRFIAFVANAGDASETTTAIRVWDAQSGTSTLVSGNTNNFVTPGSLSDSPIIDNNGRFIVFVSSASDLAENASPADFHVYLRDVQAQTTTLVDSDTNSSGSLIDPIITPAISDGARLIAFQRQEGAPGPINARHAYDVLARDSENIAIELISAHDPSLPSVTPQGLSAVSLSCVSFDARFVAFWSEADDVVTGDTNGLRDVLVRDTLSGTTLLVSVNTNGISGDGYSTDYAISADGRYVAFTSSADDLVSGDTNLATDVFVRDLQTSVTTLISINKSGTGPGNMGSSSPVLSSNGQFILFHSQANDLTPGMGTGISIDNLFWKDLTVNRTYALTTNVAQTHVAAASMTPDGRLVAVATESYNNPLAPATQLYVWNSGSTSIVYSLTGSFGSFGPLAISPDGRTLLCVTNFAGTAHLLAVDLAAKTNWVIASYQSLVTSTPRFSADSRSLAYVASLGSFPDINQIFLYDFQSHTNLLVSHGYDGVSPGDNPSDSPDITSDGKFVSYRSSASNLVPGGTNALPNIFLYDLSSGTTTLVTPSRFGSSTADNRSLAPVFSGDGHTLIFESWAGDLIPNDFNHAIDVFAVDLYGGTNVPAFTLSVSSPGGPGLANWLSWPVLPGKNYRVQFKQNLSDTSWQDLNVQPSIIGNQAHLQDPAPATTQRFYRVVAF